MSGCVVCASNNSNNKKQVPAALGTYPVKFSETGETAYAPLCKACVLLTGSTPASAQSGIDRAFRAGLLSAPVPAAEVSAEAAVEAPAEPQMTTVDALLQIIGAPDAEAEAEADDEEIPELEDINDV